MPNNYRQYLGDSVYADFDGFHVVLTTENGLPGDPSNTIYLDPHVLAALGAYAKKIIEAIGKEKEI